LTANQEKAAGHLQQHPGERLRLERIARDVGLTTQQASIALCGLLNNGLLPGLTRPSRGTYRWDPAEAATASELVRLRWETVTFYTADVPKRDVPPEILSGLRQRGDLVESFLDRLIVGDLSREVGQDGGTILEIEKL
jgi:hypothetical protein